MTEQTMEAMPPDTGDQPAREERSVGTAYLAMIGFPVGAHRWYLGHDRGHPHVVTFVLLALARFAFRERVEADFAPIWTVAVALVVAQLILDAIAIPRWVRRDPRRRFPRRC